MTAGRKCGLIAALDTIDAAEASAWAAAVVPPCGMVKLGLELFAAHGPAGVEAFARWPVFLDLKLHDIPNTVAGAVRAVLTLRPAMLTLHAAGGGAMLRAAREAAEAAGDARPRLLAVTVLTSLDAAALRATGVADTPAAQVLRLARLALDAGVDGLVCAPTEVALLRAELGPAPLLVVPGIRPAGGAADDQARTLTPRAAAEAGADGLVVGRPITQAADPHAAASAIAAEDDLRVIRVKVCGIAAEAAFDAAVAAGADWVGFVFFPPSPRAVTPARAAALSARRSGGPLRVGLFVDPDDDAVAAALAAVRLDALQLYASAARAAALRTHFGVPVWRAVGVGAPADLPAHAEDVDAFVIEPKPPAGATRPGGNAVSLDWTLTAGWSAPLPWLLAGGLTPENVAAAIRASGAASVDVSSGVERTKGEKDPALIRAFVAAARAADQSPSPASPSSR